METVSDFFIKRENNILKQLVKNGFFWMNYSSTDCDGCSSESAIKYTSLDEFYASEENTAEWSDGSFSYILAEQYKDGSFDLVESFKGGQWE